MIIGDIFVLVVMFISISVIFNSQWKFCGWNDVWKISRTGKKWM